MIVNIDGNIFEIRNRENCLVQQTLANGKYWEHAQLVMLKTIIKQLQLKRALVIGAHIGSIAIPIAHQLEAITVFEPHPGTFAHLIHNIRLNNMRHFTAYNYGVGKAFETGYISMPANESNNGHIFTQADIDNNIRSAGRYEIPPETINIVPLDQVNISPFDLLIMDVEGMEHEIIEGARQVITANKPVIMMEIWCDRKREYERMPTTERDIINYMCDTFGYLHVGNLADDHFFVHPSKLNLGTLFPGFMQSWAPQP
jgi:FkbM family methyltransferase